MAMDWAQETLRGHGYLGTTSRMSSGLLAIITESGDLKGGADFLSQNGVPQLPMDTAKQVPRGQVCLTGMPLIIDEWHIKCASSLSLIREMLCFRNNNAWLFEK